MIKMIKGTYGLMVDGVVEAKTPQSAPFSISAKREDELVAAGVAEKVEEPEKTADPYDNMKMADLRKAAAALGVDASGAKTKAEVITMIEAAKSQADESSETASEP